MSVEVTSVDAGLSVIIDEHAVGVTVSDGNVAEVSITETSVYLNPAVVEVVVAQAEVLVDLTHAPVEVTVSQDVLVVEIGSGPRGQDGTDGASGSGVFILDVIPTGAGIVGSRTWKPAVPSEANLDTASSDTAFVRVVVGCAGDALTYSPTATVTSPLSPAVPVVLEQSATIRWFVGYADVELGPGDNTITVEHSGGGTDFVTISVMGAGPAVLGVTFGAYPGSQTELKSGDAINCTVTTESDATSVLVYGQQRTVVNGAASFTITLSSQTGQLFLTATAYNAFGTAGAQFTATTALNMNQTYPVIDIDGVIYTAGKFAFGAGDEGMLQASVTSFDSISYSSSDVSIPNPQAYSYNKPLTCIATGYKNSGTNITISATRLANGAVTSGSTLAKIATVAPTATLHILGYPARLVSSPTGVAHTVVLTPLQTLYEAPALLNASIGSWASDWSLVSGTWRRQLLIADADARGTGTFSGLDIMGLSAIGGNQIVSGAGYVVGGMAQRLVVFPAFSRVAPLGCTVGNEGKTLASFVGGNTLTRYSDNAYHANGYYVANSDGTYNAQGAYLGLSDTFLAGANTTGQLSAYFSEDA